VSLGLRASTVRGTTILAEVDSKSLSQSLTAERLTVRGLLVGFFKRQHISSSELYATPIPSVRVSVCHTHDLYQNG